jgi:hypothetical protein
MQRVTSDHTQVHLIFSIEPQNSRNIPLPRFELTAS